MYLIVYHMIIFWYIEHYKFLKHHLFDMVSCVLMNFFIFIIRFANKFFYRNWLVKLWVKWRPAEFLNFDSSCKNSNCIASSSFSTFVRRLVLGLIFQEARVDAWCGFQKIQGEYCSLHKHLPGNTLNSLIVPCKRL